ncbi:unnamed protein product, partial [Cyprideis torosa]
IEDALSAETSGLEIVTKFDVVAAPVEQEPVDPAICVDEINLILQENPVQFEPSSTNLTPDSAITITRIAQILYECNQYSFEIGGHTDSQGGEELNLRISEGRARAVMNAVLEQALEFGNLTAKGYGESEPIADNDTEEGRATNRRIEIRLIEGEENTQ